MEEPKGMILRWLETLSNNNFSVQFRDGKKHGNADALSRVEHARDPTPEEKEEAEVEACHAIRRPSPVTVEELRHHQQADPDLLTVRRWLRQDYKPTRQEVRNESDAIRQYLSIYELLILDGNRLLKRKSQGEEFAQKNRLCLPKSLQRRAIQIC